MPRGLCKLTLKHGKLIQAHLIPKALTRPEKRGLPFVESGLGRRPIRRWSSWYDNNLVSERGESILSALDAWAIAELRKNKLVWSGWGPMRSLSEDHAPLGDSGWGIREVKTSNPRRLRLFFLSLLWRAAATDRAEFSEITMPPKDLEKLRTMILSDNPEPLSFYPAQLTQLSTTGMIHNLTPLAQTKTIPAIEDQPERAVPIFRFYFDGLVAHIHRQVSDNGIAEALGPLVVGTGNKLVISTVTYEISFQRENLERLMIETTRVWPEVMARL